MKLLPLKDCDTTTSSSALTVCNLWRIGIILMVTTGTLKRAAPGALFAFELIVFESFGYSQMLIRLYLTVCFSLVQLASDCIQYGDANMARIQSENLGTLPGPARGGGTLPGPAQARGVPCQVQPGGVPNRSSWGGGGIPARGLPRGGTKVGYPPPPSWTWQVRMGGGGGGYS